MTTDAGVTVGLVQRLVAAYPGARIGDDTVAVWSEALRSVREADARAAVAELVATERRFPPLAAFHQAVATIRKRRSEAPAVDDHRALLAGPCDECENTGWTSILDPTTGRERYVRKCSRGCRPNNSSPYMPAPSKPPPRPKLPEHAQPQRAVRTPDHRAGREPGEQ